MQGGFIEIKNRDAWATIRGFVYQLDITILQWIDLRDNQILELERGEDIDVITAGLASAEPSRELEQVKYREAAFSLNQEGVLEILFNFFQHLSNNPGPGQELLFRYITNAGYATERPAIFENAASGIAVWMDLFRQTTVTSTDTRVGVIQQLLRKRIKPHLATSSATPTKAGEAAIQAQWLAFDTYISDPQQLLHFIRKVEWSTGFGDHTAIGQAVEMKLVDEHLVPDAAVSKQLYARLFLYVAKLLSQKDLKQLSRADLLAQAKLPALSAAEQNAVDFVTGLLSSFEERVDKLEAASALTASSVARLFSEVDQLNKSDTVFNYRLDTLSSTPPPLVQHGTPRTAKEQLIRQLLQPARWVNLSGINGTGKSQLAALVSRQYAVAHWLELRPYNDSAEKTALLLEKFLVLLSQRQVKPNRRAWVEEALSTLAPGTLLVLNDLPLVESGSALENLLVCLADQLAPTGIQLLTTSNFDITAHTQNLLISAYSELISE